MLAFLKAIFMILTCHGIPYEFQFKVNRYRQKDGMGSLENPGQLQYFAAQMIPLSYPVI